jgi:pre-mRNA-splicing factor ATP-dependent RNA helicase DHX38/PRP16
VCAVPLVSAKAYDRVEGFSAGVEKSSDGPKGLGEFQRRLNRFDYGTPSSDKKHGRTVALSVPEPPRDGTSSRVPNVSWDSTPMRRDSQGGKSISLDRTWDSTPRTARDSSLEPSTAAESGLPLDTREWEEEQLRLDRDWYMSNEGGVIAGDEESNPLAMYEYDTMDQRRQEELAAKKVVRHTKY